MSSSISSAHVDQSPTRAKPSGMPNSEQLVKTPNQLPQGADPEKREVGAENFLVGMIKSFDLSSGK